MNPVESSEEKETSEETKEPIELAHLKDSNERLGAIVKHYMGKDADVEQEMGYVSKGVYRPVNAGGTSTRTNGEAVKRVRDMSNDEYKSWKDGKMFTDMGE